ncbi:release factor glutamine methyltransferase [Neptunitalea chrysea]|uniref:peptide chain release factor N(5)-glutamine methyltransferase n=1 Tax=Neptunitalea chrysea TaxID=1647581 RepID=A0A9W6EU36_9FLAO|nr:peptide chain release factor N(5)-glutamine methyltransferase [Neptunitalea chrysea]GLB51201.1 release factor glutamine methyltransferase [Neptunitalea chrysea]
MKLKELHIAFQDALFGLTDKEEINSFFFMLTEHFVKISRLQLALQPDLEINEEQRDLMLHALEGLKKERPIQYIIGKAFFYDLVFEVDENTLIPRPETEELVDWIVSDVKGVGIENPQVLDIGTGSGCIAITVAHELPKAAVLALDVSEKALEKAYNNAKLNKVNVTFKIQDILKVDSQMSDLPLCSVIVSNPPYVRELEKKEMKKNVLEYEPDTALFVSDGNPLLFYDKISDIALTNLEEGGLLYFEINQYLAKETKELVTSKGFKEVTLRKDIYGNYRMLKAIKA